MNRRVASNEPGRRSVPGGGLGLALVAAVLVLATAQLWWTLQIRSRLDELGDTAVRLEKATLDFENLESRLAELQVVADEWDFIVEDVQRMDTKLAQLISTLEDRTGTEIDTPNPQPPQLDWTEPSLYEAARRAAESVGITLADGEVRVPARIVMYEGILEYFAVLKGGKEHEALISLIGNTPAEARRPPDFGAKLNNAIQALGFQRGTPIRFTATGTKPAKGQTVYLFLEWEEDGEKVLVRCEDLIWNRIKHRPMARDSWVYVGSSWVSDYEPDEMIFAADLTAEAIATYSAINTIIDNTTEGAADDTVFLAATPRIPKDLPFVTLVIRIEDREPTRNFEDEMPTEDGDGDGGDVGGESDGDR